MAVKKTKLSGLLIYSYLKDGSLQQFKRYRVLNKGYGLSANGVCKRIRGWISGRSLPE